MERGEEISNEPAGGPVGKVTPEERRVDRTSVGSLPELDLPGHWDLPQTNGEIAADFDDPS